MTTLDDNGRPDIARANFGKVTPAHSATAKLFKEEINALMDKYLRADSYIGPETGRLLALARTHIETASMFAVKAFTGPEINP